MSALTLANQLTLLRLALVPAFVLLVLYGRFGWALTAFITAGITDGLDGLIARMTNQRTNLGAFLDPMADKLLLVSAFVVLTLPNIGWPTGSRSGSRSWSSAATSSSSPRWPS